MTGTSSALGAIGLGGVATTKRYDYRRSTRVPREITGHIVYLITDDNPAVGTGRMFSHLGRGQYQITGVTGVVRVS